MSDNTELCNKFHDFSTTLRRAAAADIERRKAQDDMAKKLRTQEDLDLNPELCVPRLVDVAAFLRQYPSARDNLHEAAELVKQQYLQEIYKLIENLPSRFVRELQAGNVVWISFAGIMMPLGPDDVTYERFAKCT